MECTSLQGDAGLQHTATLQRTTTCCNSLQHTATGSFDGMYLVLEGDTGDELEDTDCVAVCCSELQCVVVCCSIAV